MKPATNANQTITAQNTELLIAILTENYSHVHALTELLQAERTCLETRHRGQLTSLIKDKGLCLQKINATEKRLEQLLIKLKRKDSIEKNQSAQQKPELMNADTIESIIKTCPLNYRSHLESNWEKLREAIQECQKLNAINGQIINKSKANVQTILEMMRGCSTQLDIYHSDGHKERSSEQRTLAKA